MQKEKGPSYTILGVDPGTCITGYGVISSSSGELRVLDYGCIRPPPKALLSTRYKIIFEGLSSLIQKHTPHAVAVETQFVHKNPNSALKLGMARGMAILAASLQNIPLFEYPPRKAKLAVVGNGAASKLQVQKMIQILLRLPHLPEPEDAADALALAICHSNSLKGSHFLQGLAL